MNFRSPFSFNDIPISLSLSLVIDLPSTQRHLPPSIHHSNPRRSIIIHTKNSLSPLREKLSSRLLLLFSIEHPLSPPSPSLIHRSCILSSNAVADRNCESERRAGRRWADKTVVIKERSREIFPRQRSDIYTVLPASVKTRSLLAGARESRLPSAIAMRNATSRRGMLGPLDVRG